MFKYLKINYFCSKNILNKNLYKYNKDISARLRNDNNYNFYHHFLYDINLMNLMNTMFLVKRDFEKIVFIGPNPDMFLKKLPPSK